MSVPGTLEVAVLAASLLERLAIRYVVVGSVASSIHGEPRATLDVDITLLREEREVPILARALGRDFHIDERRARVSTGSTSRAGRLRSVSWISCSVR